MVRRIQKRAVRNEHRNLKNRNTCRRVQSLDKPGFLLSSS